MGAATTTTNELFFAKVPPSLSLEVVQEVFHRFGSCQVTLFKRWATARTSKGCGIVTYADPAAAAAALEALHGKHRWPESEVPLVVEMMDQSRQKPAPPKAASNTKQASRNSSVDGHSSSSSNAGCRLEQHQKHSPAVSSPMAPQQSFPMAWRQQSSSSQPSVPSATTSADEDTMLQYVPFCSRNPSSQSAGSMDSSWGSWESPGSVPVHLLPVTADIQAFVLRNELTACQQLKLQPEQPQPSATPIMSLQEAAVAAGLLRGCSFGSGPLPVPGSEDIRAAAEQLARSTSSMVLSSSHSNTMSAASMAEVARAASATALLAQQQQQLPEGLLQLSDPWIDANSTSNSNSLCANAAALASAQGAGLFYGPQAAAALPGRLAPNHGNGSGMLLDGAPKHPGGQYAPGTAAPWPLDLQQLYQQQQAGLLLQAATAPGVGSGSFGACAAAPAWSGGAAAMPGLQPEQPELASCVSVDVSYALAGKAASTMGVISSMTRAHIEMVAVDGALKLAMTGTPDQLNQALHLYCLALS